MSDQTTPAFPSEAYGGLGYTTGMTLRDYFAAKALPLAIQINKETNDSNLGEAEWSWNSEDYRHITRVAYEIADEMLKAREQ